MKTMAALKNEMLTLHAMTADHRDDIHRAVEAADAAAEAFELVFGFGPWESPEHAPGWVTARARVAALEDAPGYYWAVSRLQDLRHAFGRFDGEQVRMVVPSKLEGCDIHVVGVNDMPAVHPSVGAFVAARIMGVVPAASDVQIAECVRQILAA